MIKQQQEKLDLDCEKRQQENRIIAFTSETFLVF